MTLTRSPSATYSTYTIRVRDSLTVCYVILCFRLLYIILTKEAVDDAKQTTHGADDRRDDVILPL